MRNKAIALIACAGSGVRAGLFRNKLLYKAGGKTIAEYALDNFLDAKKQGIISDIIILCSENDKSEFEKIAARYGAAVTLGGGTRAQSVRKGLSYVKNNFATDNNAIILVCDGARPNCTVDIIKRCVEAAIKYGGGIAAVPVTDTIKSGENGIAACGAARKNLYAAQTPQAFIFDVLFNAYEKAGDDAGGLTDDAEIMERFGDKSCKIRLVEGSHSNYKITAVEDIDRFGNEKFAEQHKEAGECAASRGGLRPSDANLRIGIGSDTHRLVAGRKLILGGVEIPHGTGLQGHSDADALVHSVIDALLSAAGFRDIGFYFPDTDERYKDADSILLLRETADMLKEKQAKIVNISAIIHAEAPKMNPHIPQMAENIARALNTEKGRVSISAKTGEGAGAAGEGKAVVCEAAVLLNN